MTIFLVLLSIAILVLLIVWAKLNPFLAFLIASITAGFLLGLPADQIAGSVQKGMGNLLGDLVIVIVMGAMLGKLVAESGAAQRIANTLMNIFGEKYITWAMALTGLIVGIPLFYNVGFVLLVPLAFTVAYQYKISAVYVGIPLLAALSVTHGFLPPHPSPAALVAQFEANMGLTLFYGFLITIPTVAIAGPIFATQLKKVEAKPLKTFQAEIKEEKDLPGNANSFITALLPVFLLVGTTAISLNWETSGELNELIGFISNPGIVMIISVLIGTYTLGLRRRFSMKQLMSLYTDATKDIAMILLIVAGAGALKQVFTDTGVSQVIADGLKTWQMHPLILAWLITAIIRVCVGSATVAGLTTAGIIAPLVTTMNVDPNLLVLSIGAGSLMFSHFNDAGFWMYKEFFNVSIKDTIRTWSLMETLVAVIGLIGVLILDIFI
ncbi:MAG TPA: gluconate transporter [Algoriphagus sp.]|jgi:Gnt-I system high-affinity gluconate transporter|uniref:gluconate:H+ symporter n=1 Tax=Algoriphagus TaxID=246875 RepID=UPI000C519957|nr:MULTISPECIES: gluconate:H+ symporter [Algoriphagus]MAL13521.1 gluconate transporter [Algoriphagus sp.]MAN88683.1 gluconate transporter [Algoriphagus sp.]QYH40255.1 TRAP transporter large permease subunit [Algoriphagus sp. NBT04N3]HAD51253.1 gluconate transporter [Algoriphagus sp.]HAS61052.1 gluconate transporter [Algoriphagus sp.]|tara:strand:- start:23 stop:1336 length:1314 start_codon:yes stop_codon:yes gene_type:complete